MTNQQPQTKSNNGCVALGLLIVGVLLSFLVAMPLIFLSSAGQFVDEALVVADEVAAEIIDSGVLETSIALVNSLTTPISPPMVITATLSPWAQATAIPPTAVGISHAEMHATNAWADEECRRLRSRGLVDERGELECFESFTGCHHASKKHDYKSGPRTYFLGCRG